MFDKVSELKHQAAGMADKAKYLASKVSAGVSGGEGITAKIDDATSKIPGMGGRSGRRRSTTCTRSRRVTL